MVQRFCRVERTESFDRLKYIERPHRPFPGLPAITEQFKVAILESSHPRVVASLETGKQEFQRFAILINCFDVT